MSHIDLTRTPGFHVLVAEDDADDRLLFQEACEEIDPALSLRFARDGVELLELLEAGGRTNPSLLVLDINMPRMTGKEVLLALRCDPDRRTIPTVVMSTSILQADIDSAYELGANGFVAKPTRFRDLVRDVEVMLDYWRGCVRLPSGSGDAPPDPTR